MTWRWAYFGLSLCLTLGAAFFGVPTALLAAASALQLTLAIEAVNAPDSFLLDQLYRSRALAILGDVDGRRSLRGLLQAPDPIVRARATFAIAEAWMPESGGMLLQLLTDEDPLVRARAAHALILLYYPSSPYRGRRMAIDSQGGDGFGHAI